MQVLIADDHKIFREGLRVLLQNEPDIEVLGEADNGRTIVKIAKQLRPDLVIMDVTMPGLNGIEATRLIRAAEMDIKVLALSMHSDKRFILQMLQAGASGYLLKDCAFEELTLAIDALNNNHIYLSPGVNDVVIDDYIQQSVSTKVSATTDKITPREREVLQLVAEGNSTLEIAKLLNISGKTVDTHRRQIMHKLDLHSIAELTKYAVREGITILDR
jgi:two-component system, NarL family, response regulator NreC